LVYYKKECRSNLEHCLRFNAPVSNLSHFTSEGVNVPLQGVKRHFHLQDQNEFSIMVSYGEVLIGINAHNYIHLVENELEKHCAKWLCIDFHDNKNICERLRQEARFNIARGLLKIGIAESISNSSTGASHIQPATMRLSIFDFNPCLISSEIWANSKITIQRTAIFI
jgi:hypothetical protein